MYRTRLMLYKGVAVTPDMAKALRALEASANDSKWKVRFIKPTTTPVHSPISLVPAGREVQLVFERDGVDAQESLYSAWGCAIPLGFTPKLRDPLVDLGFEVYRYFGLWQALYGKLLAEGRGHLAWSSLCCAAQVDAGVWQGGKEEARFVQTQLHRLGRNCGPIDGVVGQRTAAAIESLALPRGSLAVVGEYLRTAESPATTKPKVSRGHIHLPGHDLVVAGYGGVNAWPMDNGAGFEVSGPGRIIVDVR